MLTLRGVGYLFAAQRDGLSMNLGPVSPLCGANCAGISACGYAFIDAGVVYPLLAAIRLFTWEALNGFPGLLAGQGAGAPQHAHQEVGSRPRPHRHGWVMAHHHRSSTGQASKAASPRPPPPLRMEQAKTAPLLLNNSRGPTALLGLVMMAVISVALLVVAYPVARGLARRIERIAVPVTAFGRGSAARAPRTGPAEIGELAHEFNAAAERIEALVQAQKSPLANASHEPRLSPLASASRCNWKQIGERSSVDIRNDIRAEIRELDALVEEILLSSRLQSENRPALDDEVELLGLAAEEAARAGVDVDVASSPCAAISVCCDG